MRIARVDKPIEMPRSREERIYVSRANKLSIYIGWENLFVKAFYECGNNVKSIVRAMANGSISQSENTAHMIQFIVGELTETYVNCTR